MDALVGNLRSLSANVRYNHVRAQYHAVDRIALPRRAYVYRTCLTRSARRSLDNRMVAWVDAA